MQKSECANIKPTLPTWCLAASLADRGLSIDTSALLRERENAQVILDNLIQIFQSNSFEETN